MPRKDTLGVLPLGANRARATQDGPEIAAHTSDVERIDPMCTALVSPTRTPRESDAARLAAADINRVDIVRDERRACEVVGRFGTTPARLDSARGTVSIRRNFGAGSDVEMCGGCPTGARGSMNNARQMAVYPRNEEQKLR